MGLFLSGSGAIGADRESVIRSIGSFVQSRGGRFEPSSETTPERDLAAIGENAGNTTVVYPRDFHDWDDASKFISADLNVPVFSLHIHDGDLWMIIAFENGEEVAWFNPIPDYWGETTAAEQRKWAGDPDTIARLAGIQPDRISRYLVSWNDDGTMPSGKAYDGDESDYGTDWQLTDFMARIGLKYPILADGTVDGQEYFLRVKRPSRRRPNEDNKPIQFAPIKAPIVREPVVKPPWWKFW